MNKHQYKGKLFTNKMKIFYLIASLISFQEFIASSQKYDIEEYAQNITNNKIIKEIIIVGNTYMPDKAIRSKIPYRINDKFNPVHTKKLIQNIYDLGYAKNIIVEIEDVSDSHINLYIIIKEKKKVDKVIFKGNKRFSDEEFLEKKLKIAQIPAMDEFEVQSIADQIKNLYVEKNYHRVNVNAQLRAISDSMVEAIFDIDEGTSTIVKRVRFNGNKSISSKKLRSMLMTKEAWVLGFLDRAGTYNPIMVEQDRHRIESIYQNAGYFAAKVKDAIVEPDLNDDCGLNVTFCIEEGDLYTISKVGAQGNELLSEEQILSRIPIRPGQYYSRELIGKSMENLKLVWGQYGYIYADIEPIIIPDMENKTVELSFNVELGNKIYLNRLSIIGNNKTRDYVIRRLINLQEDEIVTNAGMESSKDLVEGLGFFDPKDGVNWKINRLDENTVDLDLVVKETKTGNVALEMGYGGTDRDPKSPTLGLRTRLVAGNRNAFGSGIAYNFSLNWSKEDRGFNFNLNNPWMFDKPITGGLDAYHRKTTYEGIKNIKSIPVEVITGFGAVTGLALSGYVNTRALVTFGFEKIDFENKVELALNNFNVIPAQKELINSRLQRQFSDGKFSWFGGSLAQDVRNNPIFPNRGYQWLAVVKASPKSCFSDYGFVKWEFDSSWLTPLISEYALVFLMHFHAGFVKDIGNSNIPYRELFNLGGPSTVRGFNFGQIGPQLYGDSLGGTKSFWINLELFSAVTPDLSVRAVCFYDGGASWDAFNIDGIDGIRNNKFRYRHSIGFGIRLTQPAPIKLDWGFKLDRNKRAGESASEVHFSMAQDF